MIYTTNYTSPIGEILLASDGESLTGLWFEGQKYFGSTLEGETEEKKLTIFALTEKWLDTYFKGEEPDFEVPVAFNGTDFQNTVWKILTEIPYGKTVTYGEIGKLIAEKRGVETMSAQAVGGAVGRNPVSIIVPCHRVLGSKGEVTGYAGGIDRKIYLLKHEK